MKDYKVETLIYYSKATFNKYHIADDSHRDIQLKLDEHAQNGYRLTSTDAASFGRALYIYLYFEKDV